jgi:N-methylhydantoinase B
LNKIELVYPDGETRRLTSKDLVRGVPRGTLYVQHAGGGGGTGDPRERPLEQVREEVANGVVSYRVAREAYGRTASELAGLEGDE